jgi:hypothetical protein
MNKNTNLFFPYFLRLSHLYESDLGLYEEEEFRRLVDLEVKRSARSKTVSLLLLLDLTYFHGKTEGDSVIRNIASALFASTSEVDAKGWHQFPSVLGLLITDLIEADDYLNGARDAIVTRVRKNLAKNLNSSDLERILFSCHFCSLPGNDLLSRTSRQA